MSGAEESGSAPPEGPPLPVPTERAVSPSPPVSGEEEWPVLQRRGRRAQVLAGACSRLSQRCVFILVCNVPTLGICGASSLGTQEEAAVCRGKSER